MLIDFGTLIVNEDKIRYMYLDSLTGELVIVYDDYGKQRIMERDTDGTSRMMEAIRQSQRLRRNPDDG